MSLVDCHVHGSTGVAMRAFRAHLEQTGTLDEGPHHLWASPAFEDPRLQVEALDDAGLDAAVITHSSQTPTALHAAAVKAGRSGPEMIALANAELARWFELSGGRLWPTAWIDPRMLDSALDEIARAADTPGTVGASVLCAYPARDGSLRFLDHPDFEPALALAEQLRLPLFVHASARYPLGAQDLPGLAGAFVTGGMAMLVESTLCLLRLIASGTLERHPGLRLVFGQLGGVFPFLLGRLEFIHRLLGADALRNPRDHVDHLYVDTHSMDAPAIACATDVLGEERILFGSDFPVTPPALGRHDRATIERFGANAEALVSEGAIA
jgi:predicted TIM-barrel fold metal-dependent hydrolase